MKERMKTLEEYHEDAGPVLWWRDGEPPYAGTPLDDDWPGDDYYKGWTPLPEWPDPPPEDVPEPELRLRVKLAIDWMTSPELDAGTALGLVLRLLSAPKGVFCIRCGRLRNIHGECSDCHPRLYP